MKAFIISICILVLVTSLVILNCRLIDKVCASLAKCATEITPISNESVDNFKAEWEKYKFFISVSTTHVIIEEINEGIAHIEGCFETENFDELEQYKIFVIVRLKDIAENARFSSDGVF